MHSLLYWLSAKIKELYGWSTKWAKSKHAEKALFGLTFAESSFFPIPPDPLLMAMVFNKTDRWLRLATIATVASVLGGIFGYVIGATVFDSISDWFLNTYHLHEDFETVKQWYNDYSFIAVLGAAITPIPYKLFTITAGLFSINFFGFVIASILGRGLRFFAVSMLASYLGKKHKEAIEKYIDVVSLVILVLVVVAVVATR